MVRGRESAWPTWSGTVPAGADPTEWPARLPASDKVGRDRRPGSRPARARTAEATGKPDLFPGGCTGANSDAENSCGRIRPGRVCLQYRAARWHGVRKGLVCSSGQGRRVRVERSARPREFRLGYRLGLRSPGTATKLVGQPAGPACASGTTARRARSVPGPHGGDRVWCQFRNSCARFTTLH